jgi:alanine racemase
MVDVTDVAQAGAGDEVILLGAQGDESVSAEDLARLADTINYEIVTRAAPGSPRILVP